MFMRKSMTTYALVAVMVVFLSALSACGGSIQDRYDKASAHYAAGEYRPAEIQLKNVLQKAPENARAWLLLGRVSLATSQYSDAVEQFQRAEANGIDAKTLAVPMARSLLGAGQNEEVIGLMSPDKFEDIETRAQLWTIRGQAYRRLEKPDQAASAFAKALAAQPGFAPARVGQAQLAATDDDDAKAKKILDQLVAANPDYAPAFEARGKLAYNNNNCSQAETAFNQALNNKEKPLPLERQFIARAYMAECQIRQTKYNAAQDNVARLMEQNSSNAYANYLQSLLDMQNKDYDQATAHLQQVLKVAPDNPQALMLLASVKIAQDDFQLAEVYLKNALTSAPGDARALRMLAALYMHQKETSKAIGLLQEAHSRNPDNPAVRAMLAEAVARGGDAKTVQAYAQPGSEVGESNRGMQMDLARAMAQKGDNDAALRLLDQMKSQGADAQLQASLLKIRVYLQQGQNDKAIAAAQRLLDQSPNDPGLLRAMAVTQVAAGHDDKAKNAFEQALAADPDDADTRFALGLLALREKNYDRAIRYFKGALSAQPDNLRTLMALARTESARGDIRAALPWLEKAYEINTSKPAVTGALAKAYLATGNGDQALPLLERLVADKPDNAEFRRMHGVALLGAGKAEAGIDELRKAAGMKPDKPDYQLDLARAELAHGNAEDAVRDLEKLRDNHPDFTPALPTLAMAQLRAGQADAALDTAASLGGTANGERNSNMLRGDILGSQGEYTAAAKAYARAYAVQPSRAVAMNLFEARRRAGLPDPQQSLEDWIEQNPRDFGVRIVLGQWYQKRKRLDDAAEQYRAVLDKNPEQLAALNNLALVLDRQNNANALSLAQKAYDIAPDNPAVIDTLGWITATSGQTERGLALVRKAAKAAPSSQDIQYHLAAILARRSNAGDDDQARRILTRILESKGAFENREEAQALADKLASAQPETADQE